MADSRSARTTTVPLLAFSCLILAVSSVPGNKLPDASSIWQADKLAHYGEYAILAVFTMRYLQLRRLQKTQLSVLVSIVSCSIFATLDELHQMLIPLRMCAWQDLVADTAGVMSGTLVAAAVLRKKMPL